MIGLVDIAMKRGCLALLAGLALSLTSALAAEGAASFTVDVKLGDTPLELLQVTLNCREGGTSTLNAQIPPGDTRSFSIPVRDDAELTCLLGAMPIAGQRLRFLGDGGSAVELSAEGCLFSGVRAGHANFCQIQIEGERTSLTVYKKWIGTGGAEPDVEIHLECQGLPAPLPKAINQDQPGGWKLDLTDPEGVSCTVQETEREEFRADTSDCQNLIIVPGAQEECTLVNTKVVKMIQMLNRYGLVIMIAVFLVVGMTAARRMMP